VESETLGVTAPHPFWVSNRTQPGFIPAGELRAGDELRLANGGQAIVTANTQEAAPLGETFTTYNFEVADFHTYFAGRSEVWVHNDSLADCQRAFSLWKVLMERNGGNHWQAMRSLFVRLGNRPNRIIELLDLRQAVYKDVLKAKHPNGMAVYPNRLGDKPPGMRLKSVYSLKKTSGHHEADFIVTKSGELRVGRGHPYLADGDEVIAAGRATFNNGKLVILNNWSGHYLPTGVDPGIPNGAWLSHGFDEAVDLYKETLTPKW
jgi:hypothetical protein